MPIADANFAAESKIAVARPLMNWKPVSNGLRVRWKSRSLTDSEQKASAEKTW